MSETTIATQLALTLYLGLENNMKKLRRDVTEMKRKIFQLVVTVDNMGRCFDGRILLKSRP